MQYRRTIVVLAALAALLALVATAFASDGGGSACEEPTITVVDSPEHVVHHEAVMGDRVLNVWTGGPVEGNPSADADGWNETSGNPQGGPFQGQTDGVPFFVSHGNSGLGDWFMFTTPVLVEAYDETIPAATHEEPNPDYPCGEDNPGDPGDPGDNPGDETGGDVAGQGNDHGVKADPEIQPVLGSTPQVSGDLPFTK
jgi:hypothetical protein